MGRRTLLYYSFVFCFKTNAITIVLILSYTLFVMYFFSHAIAGNFMVLFCMENLWCQIIMVVQYCMQIKTSFKFRFF